MSKHHLSIRITNAVHVRNLACEICVNYDDVGKDKRLVKINFTYEFSICIYHPHALINRDETTLCDHIDLQINKNILKKFYYIGEQLEMGYMKLVLDKTYIL